MTVGITTSNEDSIKALASDISRYEVGLDVNDLERRDEKFMYEGGYTFLRYLARQAGDLTIANSKTSNTLLLTFYGNDTITNSASKVTIQSGDGKDSIKSSANNVTISGEDGNDSIIASGKNLSISAGSGKDYVSISSSSSSVTIDGGDGNDEIHNSGGSNGLVDGGKGADTIYASGSGYSFVMPGDNVTVNVSFTLIKATSPAPLTPTPGDAGGGKEEEWRKSIMPDFGDITRDYWCYDEIEWAYQEGLMLGTSEDKYQPEKYISSATAVVVLSRMEKVDPKNFENLSYSQVPRGKWFTGQANWAKSRNLLPDSLYVTDEAILSRGEMALILLNYLKFKGKDCNIYSRVDFPDADLMSPAENDAFQVLYRYKIFLGVENRRMNVDKPTTRAHLAALLHRLYYVVS